MARPLRLLGGLLLALGCGHYRPLRADATVCAEYRDLLCATPPECSMDRARGCRVCRCQQAPYPAAGSGQLPSPVAPDQRGATE